MKSNKAKKHIWKKNLSPDEWVSVRASMEGIGEDFVRVGGSDIGAVMFSSKWKCKRRLAKHLVGEYSCFEITDTTLDGVLQEPLVAQMWESWDADVVVARLQTQNGIKVRRIKKAKFFMTNPSYPHLFVSLDFIPFDKQQYSPFTGELYHPLTPIECKVTSKDYYRRWNYKGYPITEGYYAQLQSQMAVTNTPLAVFLVKIRETGKFIPIEIPRDDEFIEEMVAVVDEFVEVVQKCKICYFSYLLYTGQDDCERDGIWETYQSLLPPFGGTDDDVALADEEWEAPIDPDSEYLKATEEVEAMMAEYMRCGDVEKMLTEEKNKIKANLKHLSSGFEGIKGESYKAIIRGSRSDKKAYFGVSKLK